MGKTTRNSVVLNIHKFPIAYIFDILTYKNQRASVTLTFLLSPENVE
jgi:hypothetical protein